MKREGSGAAAGRAARRGERRGRHPASVRMLVLAGAAVLLSACAAGPNPAVAADQQAGFLLGLWHGLIVPVTFVISLFSDQVNVYEVANSGNWYDFGFVLGIASSLGGGGGAGASSRRRVTRT